MPYTNGHNLTFTKNHKASEGSFESLYDVLSDFKNIFFLKSIMAAIKSIMAANKGENS